MILFQQVCRESRKVLPRATTTVANGTLRSSLYQNVILQKHPLSNWTQPTTKVTNYKGFPAAVRTFSSTVRDDVYPVTIKPWKVPMVESKGDYRDEAFLERDDEIGGPLYRNQATLPRLPVPEVKDTIRRFLPTALPLAKNEEEAKGLEKACEAFLEEAKVLQERLLHRANNEMKGSSYLQLYWNTLGYLQVRDSVVVNVSYFFQFQNDSTLSKSRPNIERAAALLYSTAEFRKEVCSGALEPEVMGKAQIPLDATAFKYMFHACRIPRKVQDNYRIYDPSRHNHAIVARKGNFYSINIVDDAGDPLPLSVIEEQLQQCIEMADDLVVPRPKLGILTSTNRDNWADARAKLIQLGGEQMERALQLLESGALMVNLDDSDLVDDVECSEMMLTGRKQSGDNRWFDKSIQIVVDNNGLAGTLSEHSMMDGMPVVRFADYITSFTYDEVKQRSTERSNEASYQVVDIFGEALNNMDENPLRELESQARDEFHQNIGRQSTSVVTFENYGSNFIKKSKNPPDAYAQLALQLATYRLFGEQVGTYEATQVRRFLHGRTEVTRAVSFESAEFVKSMGRTASKEPHPEATKEKLELLRKATAAHASYSQMAAQAMGVDRHFFGLSMQVDSQDGIPAIYSDPVFNRSKHWRLSTSNLSHPRIVNWGFGQVVPDGLGVGYSIHPDSLKFNISALAETRWTPKFAELLVQTLEEMAIIASSDMEEQPISKL
ncbi:choline/carnitine o-acyltransferase [Nitzschia inconspicua]|uniref:Choline/carnitine o-acyltransferase n=1 Tax=Nitzschia inconspicua TaxID=303405 RepID=A0A9K3KPB1_9STRA|nr:choline/carnitine o-acyltransferase [Nitzschia inconspicua]